MRRIAGMSLECVCTVVKTSLSAGTSLECVCAVVKTSLSALLRMRNVSYKSYRENHNTNFMSSIFFPEIPTVYEKVIEPDRPQTTV
jgi:hypothetical protein